MKTKTEKGPRTITPRTKAPGTGLTKRVESLEAKVKEMDDYLRRAYRLANHAYNGAKWVTLHLKTIERKIDKKGGRK